MRHKELKKIREQLGYTVRDFALLIGLGDNFTTYHGYETGRRSCPDNVIDEARAALKRDREFFTKQLPASVDANCKKGVPNEARKGDW